LSREQEEDRPERALWKGPEAPGGNEAEIDLSDAAPPVWVRAIGSILGASGFLVVGTAAQLVFFFTLAVWVKVVVGVLGILGLCLIAIAPWVFKARSWACISGSLFAGLTSLAMGLWVLYSFSITLFSPLAILAALCCGLATLTMPLTIPTAIRITATRKALYA
jgi:hypothetical protein